MSTTDLTLFDIGKSEAPCMRERFGWPVFSVLDAQSGEWQARKRAWKAFLGADATSRTVTRQAPGYLARGVQIHAGSAAFTGANSAMRAMKVRDDGSIVSEFDPVLAEILIGWYSEPGDAILDPFSGGPVRGGVAVAMGRKYFGFDLNAEQIDDNSRRVPSATYAVADSRSADFPPCDLVLTCPPYGCLEVYSDDARDLSGMPRQEFLQSLEAVIRRAVDQLKPGGFAVVGAYRDGAALVDLPAHVSLMSVAADLWDIGVLRRAAATLPLRASYAWARTKRLGRQHECFVVFRKSAP